MLNKNIYNPLKNQTVNDTLLTATKNGGKQNECYYICKKDSLKNIYLKNHEKQITEFIGSSGYTKIYLSVVYKNIAPDSASLSQRFDAIMHNMCLKLLIFLFKYDIIVNNSNMGYNPLGL